MNKIVGKLEEKVRNMEGNFSEGIQTWKRNHTETNVKQSTEKPNQKASPSDKIKEFGNAGQSWDKNILRQTHTHACTHVYKINMSSIFRKLGIYSEDQTNLRTHGVEGGGPEINSKGSVKLFNEIIAQNILNLKIEIDIQIQEAYRTPKTLL